jgi:hypothetical protein
MQHMQVENADVSKRMGDRDIAPSPAKRPHLSLTDEEDSDDEEESWEEVEVSARAVDISVPATSFEITIPAVEKKRVITRRDRAVRRLEHKTHLLCLLSTCLNWNRLLNNPLLQSVLLSKIPVKLLDTIQAGKRMKNAINQSKVETFLQYWEGAYMKANADCELEELDTNVLITSADGSASLHPMTYSLLFAAACRAIGLDTRLVASLVPVPLSFRKSKPCQPLQFLVEIYPAGQFRPIIADPVGGVVGTNFRNDLISNASYVVSFEANNDAKEVTRRYTRF